MNNDWQAGGYCPSAPVGRVNGQVRNRENRRQKHHENRSAHVAMIGALLDTMLICYCLLNTIIVIIIEFWDFSWSLLCPTQVSVLVLGICITRGQYYGILDIGSLSWYRSNPTGQ